MGRFMITDTEFYDKLLKIKEKELLLKEREAEALEIIADSLRKIAGR